LEDAQVVAMLVRRCIAGDVVAWEEIVQRYNRRIYNICYRFAGSGDDAQDLTQEVFIKMFRTLSSYDVERGAFMTWVTTITRNLLVDHFRKSKQDRMTDSLDATPSESRTKRQPPTPASRAARRGNWCTAPCRNCRRNCAKRSSCATCKIWTTKTLP
jgi:DNA-directed RNA polymerase specialized sigma24 family protein